MESVVRLPDSNRTLQLDIKNKSWFLTVKEQCYAIANEDSSSALAVLPFLELPLKEVEETASQVLACHPKIKFPFELFIQAGFRHGSPHWTYRSLAWLAELDGLETSFKYDLEKVVANTKRYSQKSRHLAKKLIKQGR